MHSRSDTIFLGFSFLLCVYLVGMGLHWSAAPKDLVVREAIRVFPIFGGLGVFLRFPWLTVPSTVAPDYLNRHWIVR